MNTAREKLATGACAHCPTQNYCIAACLNDTQLFELEQAMNLGSQLAPGEHLFVAGDLAAHQYHVRSGCLKSYYITTSGDEHVTGFFLAGEILPSFNVNGKHAQSAVALNNVSVCAIDLGADVSAPVWRAITEHTQQMMNAAVTHQLNSKSPTAQSRVAGFCIDLMQRLAKLERAPTYIPTPMSRRDIASYLGITPESLSRALTSMKQTGVIAADRHHIEILRPDQLRSLAPQLS